MSEETEEVEVKRFVKFSEIENSSRGQYINKIVSEAKNVGL